MKRVLLLPMILALAISLAAPSGAVFASEEEVMSPPSTFAAAPEQTTVVSELQLPAPMEESTVVSSAPTLVADEPSVPVPDPPVVVPLPVVLPISPLLITAYKASGAHLHAVQLYNNSSAMTPLDGVSLSYQAGDNDYVIPLSSGWIEPRSYIVLGWQGESDYADMEFSFDQLADSQLTSIELRHEGYQPLAVSVPDGYGGELLQRYLSPAGNYTTNTSFTTGAVAVSGGGLYVLPGAPQLEVREIMVSPRVCTYGAETPDCYDYIKLRNNGTRPLDLNQYRLRSGYSNAASSATNTTYFGDILAPGETITLARDRTGNRVSFTANDGTVWLEDRYGFEAYGLEVSPYIGSALAAQNGRSWAYNDETKTWQWAMPAPFKTGNDFTETLVSKESSSGDTVLKPCRDDQYRSEETNRCRNIIVASSLTPCKEGQYRSEETNRCRSIAVTVASVLKPCGDDQFRNPSTNRCKKIASADDVVMTDCGEGRERNPETNRCRNVLASALPSAAFAVEPIREATSLFTGWWALGLVAAGGLGYGAWEWRYELLAFGRRIFPVGK